ncbi:Telomere repeat-binding factor 1 [Zea mays]|uniref:Telomere repeat-binding factor 1 n=1 Tax=Zea mays TaxID=4577 RepID=A0A1D6NKZ8_MAIZE|nr:Telomere repeat-binding factor 1 [Zea mays]
MLVVMNQPLLANISHQACDFMYMSDFSRLDDLIVEAIRKLNEPSGSNKAVISGYIEVNQKYRIAPSSSLGGISTKVSSSEGMNTENNNVKRLTKPQVVAELEKMKGMTREEAAAFAAKAVAEAEVAMAEAEEAARVAEAAENDAEAAKAFLDAVILSMRNRNAASMILRAC